MTDLNSLENKLGFSFHDRSLLEQALVHRSYLNENPYYTGGHNERMEFLGDAVLGLVIAEKLFRDFPELGEGEMTRRRAAQVCRDALVRISQKISLGAYLLMGKGEETSGGRNKAANLAGAMEALLAAVFLDDGIPAARSLIFSLWEDEFAASPGHEIDYKSRLQEALQARGYRVPVYRVVTAEGPEHARTFNVEVMTGDAVLGKGTGKSKKSAEMEAARRALEHIRRGGQAESLT